jgi:hypothetical protein
MSSSSADRHVSALQQRSAAAARRRAANIAQQNRFLFLNDSLTFPVSLPRPDFVHLTPYFFGTRGSRSSFLLAQATKSDENEDENEP